MSKYIAPGWQNALLFAVYCMLKQQDSYSSVKQATKHVFFVFFLIMFDCEF